MYDPIEDEYCYPGTSVLINKPGIRDQAELDKFEANYVSLRSGLPLPPLELTSRMYCSVHHHLFQDVYAWAGQMRTVRISKGGSLFCLPDHIRPEMEKVFRPLKTAYVASARNADGFAAQAATFLADINAIHPFREGNGRTQMTFLAALAAQAGQSLNFGNLDRVPFLQHMIESFHGNEAPLRGYLRSLLD